MSSEQPTLRSIHERCKTRHRRYIDDHGKPTELCMTCQYDSWPCADYSDAVAALALIDEAEVAWIFYGNLGTCTADKLPQLAALNGSEIVGRVIPDPFGCVGASRSGVTVHAKGTTP